MTSRDLGDYIRQLRHTKKMPLRKLASILELDQSTLSKLERGERPITRKMVPILAKTFELEERELVIKYLSTLITETLINEEFALEALDDAKYLLSNRISQ